MQVIRYKSPTEFLSATEDLRSAEIIKTNLISSIANSVANGSHAYETCYWWAVKEGNKTAGVAIRTSPYGYVFSPISEEAIRILIKEIQVGDPNAKEFSGPRSVIDKIETILGVKPIESEGELIYKLTTLNPVTQQGHVKVATEAHYALILKWMKAFIAETGIMSYNLERNVKNAIERGVYYLLEIEGVPVSLGGFAALVEVLGQKIGRVGPIYTPIEFRKRGYASVITSHITQLCIAKSAIPTLYTQSDNLTSNKIYQNLGYELIDEIRKIKF